MLRKSSEKVALCYRRAVECREREERLHDPVLRKAMRGCEDQWLALARSYELAESTADFNRECAAFAKRGDHYRHVEHRWHVCLVQGLPFLLGYAGGGPAERPSKEGH